MNNLRIPRNVICPKYTSVEIHGFSDASEAAYGACIYVRSNRSDGEVYVRLLCAKSKVAPIKTISIPRLELCEALILARLVSKIAKSFNINISEFTLWSDSTIVLGWIGVSPNLLKTFVGNRVSEMQTAVNPGTYLLPTILQTC